MDINTNNPGRKYLRTMISLLFDELVLSNPSAETPEISREEVMKLSPS